MGWDSPTIEPPPTRWGFPPVEAADESGLVAVGGDLEPGTLLAAYRSGLFPMPARRRRIGWWSPDPRGIVPVDGLRITAPSARAPGASRYASTPGSGR